MIFIKKLGLILLIVLWTHPSNAQYYGEALISINNIKPWNTKTTKDYSKSYHFGFSEGESELKIIVYDTLVVAQIHEFKIKDESQLIDTFFTLNNVKIIGNKFYSKETNGEFVVLETDKSIYSGLLVYNPWTFELYKGGEFGSAYPEDEVYFPGKYPQASISILTVTYLRSLPTRELQILRNEIFARYGYKFTIRGEMDRYFRSQKWYKPNYNNVTVFLTSIEKENIKLISKVEKERIVN